jgi:hypothetical protein
MHSPGRYRHHRRRRDSFMVGMMHRFAGSVVGSDFHFESRTSKTCPSIHFQRLWQTNDNSAATSPPSLEAELLPVVYSLFL